MKDLLEKAINTILANKTLKEQWEFALLQGGAEKVIQACLAQELHNNSGKKAFIEFNNIDIAIFDKGVDTEPSHIIEIGINYLCQHRDVHLKPLKDIFKRISHETNSSYYPANNVYSLMFIAETLEVADKETEYPQGRKSYINNTQIKLNRKNVDSATALKGIISYWKDYMKVEEVEKLNNLGGKKKILIDFKSALKHQPKISVNKLLSHEFSTHKLHCYLTQIT